MAIRILDPGLYTLVVDFGRPATRSLGVPVGGAADRSALALGNALVGNSPDSPALEFSFSGPTLKSGEPIACVVFGAPFHITRSGRRVAMGTTFTLDPDETLQIAGSPSGARGYLCFHGGIESPLVLGSRSSLEPLKAGTELHCPSARTPSRFLPRSGAAILERFFADPPAVEALHILPGLQADWFDLAEFTGQPFTVSPAGNRMGVRLQGKPLQLPERELVSEPVCPGAVQVTRDGQCIVLGVDGQTIGGYPKIAQVISADIDRLGQLRPGTSVKFVLVSREEAALRAEEQRLALAQWTVRLRESFRKA